MTLFSVGGTRIRLHASWLVLMAVMALAGSGTRAVFLFAAVLLHELAHAAWASHRRIRAYDVELLPFGGVVRLDEAALVAPSEEIPVVLAGPAFSLAVGAMLVGAGWLFDGYGGYGLELQHEGATVALAQALVGWGRDHLSLGAFNLLPVFPLDGGRLLRAAMARRAGFRAATRQVSQAGEIAGAVMAVAGAVAFAAGAGSLWTSVMGLFLLYSARAERLRASGAWIRYLARRLGDVGPLRQIQEGRLLVAPPDATVLQAAHHLVPDRFHVLITTDETGRLRRITSERELIEALLEREVTTPVAELPGRRL